MADSFSGQERPERQFPVSFRLVVRERFPVEHDAKHVAHAAHAYDPSVLDARVAVVEPPTRALYQDDRDPSLRRLRSSGQALRSR